MPTVMAGNKHMLACDLILRSAKKWLLIPPFAWVVYQDGDGAYCFGEWLFISQRSGTGLSLIPYLKAFCDAVPYVQC